MSSGFDISFGGSYIKFKYHEEANFIIEGFSDGLTIAPDGNVGIGTRYPEAKLDVDGSFKAVSADITNTLSANILNINSANINGKLKSKRGRSNPKRFSRLCFCKRL